MEINFGEILIQTLKGFWQFKGLYLMAGGVLLLALTFRILTDLLDRKSKIKSRYSPWACPGVPASESMKT